MWGGKHNQVPFLRDYVMQGPAVISLASSNLGPIMQPAEQNTCSHLIWKLLTRKIQLVCMENWLANTRGWLLQSLPRTVIKYFKGCMMEVWTKGLLFLENNQSLDQKDKRDLARFSYAAFRVFLPKMLYYKKPLNSDSWTTCHQNYFPTKQCWHRWYVLMTLLRQNNQKASFLMMMYSCHVMRRFFF